MCVGQCRRVLQYKNKSHDILSTSTPHHRTVPGPRISKIMSHQLFYRDHVCDTSSRQQCRHRRHRHNIAHTTSREVVYKRSSGKTSHGSGQSARRLSNIYSVQVYNATMLLSGGRTEYKDLALLYKTFLQTGFNRLYVIIVKLFS